MNIDSLATVEYSAEETLDSDIRMDKPSTQTLHFKHTPHGTDADDISRPPPSPLWPGQWCCHNNLPKEHDKELQVSTRPQNSPHPDLVELPWDWKFLNFHGGSNLSSSPWQYDLWGLYLWSQLPGFWRLNLWVLWVVRWGPQRIGLEFGALINPWATLSEPWGGLLCLWQCLCGFYGSKNTHECQDPSFPARTAGWVFML